MNVQEAVTAPCTRWVAVAGAYFPYLLFGCFAVGLIGGGLALALPALFILAVVPILDLLSGDSRINFVKGDFTPVQRILLALAPIGFVVGHSAVIAFAALRIAHLTDLERGLITISVGMIGSISITAAHELVHKSGALQKSFARLGLLNVHYPHFEINHIECHHVWIGTDRDESTAWRGESLYHFIARTVPGCLALSWRLEMQRLRHRGIALISRSNRMLSKAITQLLYVAVIGTISGLQGLLFFFGQAAVAVFMLESVSFIEHYGLMRERLPNGRYASMTPSHSWDSYKRFSNYLEFQLQRHADHHSTPTKAQELLRRSPDAPKLPAGYPVMITLAMVPPLWRAIMDRRIASNRSLNRLPIIAGRR
jgi:alkane 1-monooxygenase